MLIWLTFNLQISVSVCTQNKFSSLLLAMKYKRELKMEEKDIKKLINASEMVDAVLLLSNLAKSAIENETVEKIWDLHLLFEIIKKLSQEALSDLRQIQD